MSDAEAFDMLVQMRGWTNWNPGGFWVVCAPISERPSGGYNHTYAYADDDDSLADTIRELHQRWREAGAFRPITDKERREEMDRQADEYWDRYEWHLEDQAEARRDR